MSAMSAVPSIYILDVLIGTHSWVRGSVTYAASTQSRVVLRNTQCAAVKKKPLCKSLPSVINAPDPVPVNPLLWVYMVEQARCTFSNGAEVFIVSMDCCATETVCCSFSKVLRVCRSMYMVWLWEAFRNIVYLMPIFPISKQNHGGIVYELGRTCH